MDQLKVIFKMLQDGYNNAEIAKKVDRPISSIYNIRKRRYYSEESKGYVWPEV